MLNFVIRRRIAPTPGKCKHRRPILGGSQPLRLSLLFEKLEDRRMLSTGPQRWIDVGTGSLRIASIEYDGAELQTPLTQSRITGTGAAAIELVIEGDPGEAALTAMAVMPSLPGAPTDVTAVAGNGQVSLTWKAPASTGGAPISTYIIARSSDGGRGWTLVDSVNLGTRLPNATSATVTGLANGTAYVFRVAAVNIAGMGLPSEPSAPVTPDIAATTPGAPTGLFGKAGNVQASLTWMAPSSSGSGPIIDYIVQYGISGGSTWTTFNRAASTATGTTVTGLTKGMMYAFRVAAVNSAGMGPFSTIFTITVAGATDQPLAVESVTVAPGAYGARSQVPVTVVLSDIVHVRGRPQIQVSVGGQMRTATYVSGSGTAVLTFQLTVDQGMNTADFKVGNRFVFSKRSVIRAAGGRGLARELGRFAGTSSPGVRLDGVPPRVVGRVTAPPTGTYSIGQSLDFVVRFSEVVIVSGTPRIAVTGLNAARQATYVSGSGTAKLTFRFIVQADDTLRARAMLGLGRVIVVPGGATIADTAGNLPQLAIQVPALRGIVIAR
jgi:hypothetical protein